MSQNTVDLINNVIIEAIYHGGDIGGPYFSNEDDLKNAMQALIDGTEMSGKYHIDPGEYGQMFQFIKTSK